MADLAVHTVVAYSYWSGGDVWAFKGPNGPVEVTTQTRLRSNSGDNCLAAAFERPAWRTEAPGK